jgi:hypothetical protein
MRNSEEALNWVAHELAQIGPVPNDKGWLDTFVCQENSDEFFRLIVCSVRARNLTHTEFKTLDDERNWPMWEEKPALWHWKLRRCRNHSVWGPKLIEALKEVGND